ncbi:MAG: hypothetical protein D6772_17850 [Bacteroidetes bacterium]|nr:MAG: hypothetical protein D6772_17850 [Bacteroidota bacterium]
MKAKQRQSLPKHVQPLTTAEEQQVKGGYGYIPGKRVSARTSRWDDIPFRAPRTRGGVGRATPTSTQSGGWDSLVKNTLLLP